MSDTKDKGTTGGRKPLTVSRGSGSGTVKQTFSHGRSKQVVVETKKRRTVGAQSKPGAAKPGAGAKKSAASGKPQSKLAAAAAKLGITEEELIQRQKVLLQRKKAEESRKAEQEKQNARTKALEEKQHAQKQKEKEREEAEARRKTEEAERKKAEAEAKKKAETEAKSSRPERGGKRDAAPSQADLEAAASSSGGRRKGGRTDRDDRNRRDQGGGRGGRGGDTKRRRGKLTIASALGDDGDRQRSLASVKRARERERERRMGNDQAEKASVEVTLPETITLQDLAGRMKERVADVVKFMMQQGEMLRGNDIIDADTAELIAEEFGHTVKRVSEADVEIGLEGAEDDPKDLV